jgi:hypothetical protein
MTFRPRRDLSWQHRKRDWRYAVCLSVVTLLGVHAQEPAEKTQTPVPRERVLPRSGADTVAGAVPFNDSGPGQKTATWGPGEFDTGPCGIKDATVTIRADGTVSFAGAVASDNEGSDAYCTRILFRDRNGLDLFETHPDRPGDCSQTLINNWARWELHTAIPQNIFPFVTLAWRYDHC